MCATGVCSNSPPNSRKTFLEFLDKGERAKQQGKFRLAHFATLPLCYATSIFRIIGLPFIFSVEREVIASLHVAHFHVKMCPWQLVFSFPIQQFHTHDEMRHCLKVHFTGLSQLSHARLPKFEHRMLHQNFARNLKYRQTRPQASFIWRHTFSTRCTGYSSQYDGLLLFKNLQQVPQNQFIYRILLSTTATKKKQSDCVFLTD